MDRRVREVLLYVEQHWHRQVSLDELARSVNLGPSRLSHLIRDHTNTSLRDLLRRRRIAEAANLLITTHQRISEISYAVGFGDISNFNHAFRKELGVSPRVYRQRALASGERVDGGE